MRRFKNNYAKIPHPYMVEVYVAVDGSEALSCTQSAEGFCTRDDPVRGRGWSWRSAGMRCMRRRFREVCRPKGLLAFTTTAREYVKML
jgi:hypothetical protein